LGQPADRDLLASNDRHVAANLRVEIANHLACALDFELEGNRVFDRLVHPAQRRRDVAGGFTTEQQSGEQHARQTHNHYLLQHDPQPSSVLSACFASDLLARMFLPPPAAWAPAAVRSVWSKSSDLVARPLRLLRYPKFPAATVKFAAQPRFLSYRQDFLAGEARRHEISAGGSCPTMRHLRNKCAQNATFVQNEEDCETTLNRCKSES